MKKEKLPSLQYKSMVDKREAEQVRQFLKRGQHDLAKQVQDRIDSRKKNG